MDIGSNNATPAINSKARQVFGDLRAACTWLYICRQSWQGQRESNPQPSVLETDALPIELYPCGKPFTR